MPTEIGELCLLFVLFFIVHNSTSRGLKLSCKKGKLNGLTETALIFYIALINAIEIDDIFIIIMLTTGYSNGKCTDHLGNILTITTAIFDWLIKKRYLISTKLDFNKILSAERSHIACFAFTTSFRFSPEHAPRILQREHKSADVHAFEEQCHSEQIR
ncbi:hypothetical protein T4D_9827 [Trichinella pseudospiralis]|uniref:Uncharacterized protein n=1 Tax=Trichinella pseudospiralis TaxID=6337 RepID=A0A0V1FTG8_TRIPS|nr:hypothetical protein T4D_9827 [Trichinella pseudospiralis]